MNYFVFDIPRDKEGNPIEPEDKVRCPNCPPHTIMDWHEGLESWICPNCTYTVTEAYDQLALPSQQSRLEPQSKGKQKPFIKSFSSNGRDLSYEESLISERGEDNKKYIGSANNALEAEYNDFQSKQQEDRDDILRERYNESHLDMGTESSVTRFRADRERKAAMNDSK